MLSVIHVDRSKDTWIAATWKQEREASGPTRVHRHVSDPGEGVKGEDLSRKHWTTGLFEVGHLTRAWLQQTEMTV